MLKQGNSQTVLENMKLGLVSIVTSGTSELKRFWKIALTEIFLLLQWNARSACDSMSDNGVVVISFTRHNTTKKRGEKENPNDSIKGETSLATNINQIQLSLLLLRSKPHGAKASTLKITFHIFSVNVP